MVVSIIFRTFAAENIKIKINMKKFFMAIVCLMTMVIGANAQNSVVDDFATNEPTEKKYDHLVLDPQKSIKENYEVIKNLMSLHKEKDYAEYIIMIEGHYVNKYNSAYNWPVGMIEVKGKNNEYYQTISGQIIEALTELYSHSLDEPFKVEFGEYHVMQVNQKDIKVATGRTFKHQNGSVTKEYVTSKGLGNRFYCLYSTSQLYKKIYKKVMAETNLSDEGCRLTY